MGNLAVDAKGATDPSLQHEHAMQSRGMTPEESRDSANDYVNERLTTAISLGRRGQWEAAYYVLGQAMHTVQDFQSTVHGFDEPWEEGISIREMIVHVAAELFPRLGFGNRRGADGRTRQQRATAAIDNSRSLHQQFLAGVEAEDGSPLLHPDTDHFSSESDEP